jgi:hypothetical protein
MFGYCSRMFGYCSRMQPPSQITRILNVYITDLTRRSFLFLGHAFLVTEIYQHDYII